MYIARYICTYIDTYIVTYVVAYAPDGVSSFIVAIAIIVSVCTMRVIMDTCLQILPSSISITQITMAMKKS